MTYRVTTYTAFFSLVLILISAKDVDISKIIKLIFYCNLILIIIHILFYLIYCLFDYSSIQSILKIINKNISFKRHSFFFSHPNIFSMYVFWTVAMFYYLKYDRLNKVDYFFTILLIIYIYIFSNSRTCAIVMGVLLVTTIIVKLNLFKLKYLSFIYIFTVIFSVVCIFAIHSKIVMKLDSFLNTRISLGYIIYNNYGINLFGTDISNGTPIQSVNGKYFSSVKLLDSSYYSLLLNYGLVSFIVMIFITLKAIKYYTKIDNQVNIKDRILIFVWILYAISETSCLNPILGFPLLLISNALYINKVNNKK